MLFRGAGVTTTAPIKVPIGVMHSRVSCAVDLRLALAADALLAAASRPDVLGNLADRLQCSHRRIGEDRVLDTIDGQAPSSTGGSPKPGKPPPSVWLDRLRGSCVPGGRGQRRDLEPEAAAAIGQHGMLVIFVDLDAHIFGVIRLAGIVADRRRGVRRIGPEWPLM